MADGVRSPIEAVVLNRDGSVLEIVDTPHRKWVVVKSNEKFFWAFPKNKGRIMWVIPASYVIGCSNRVVLDGESDLDAPATSDEQRTTVTGLANEPERIRAVREGLSRPGNFDWANRERPKREERFLIEFLHGAKRGLVEFMRRIDRVLNQPRQSRHFRSPLQIREERGGFCC